MIPSTLDHFVYGPVDVEERIEGLLASDGMCLGIYLIDSTAVFFRSCVACVSSKAAFLLSKEQSFFHIHPLVGGYVDDVLLYRFGIVSIPSKQVYSTEQKPDGDQSGNRRQSYWCCYKRLTKLLIRWAYTFFRNPNALIPPARQRPHSAHTVATTVTTSDIVWVASSDPTVIPKLGRIEERKPTKTAT